MANVKNFGLIGVADNVQFGKGGAKITQTEGAFSLRNAGNSADAALTLSALTASTGNVTATAGNFAASAAGATFSIGGDTTLSRAAAGVFQLNGTKAVVLPSGDNAARPTGVAGMIRYNTSGVMEYYNGSSWVSIATGGEAVTAVSVASANGFAGTSSGGTTPTLTLTTTITGILQGNGTAISAASTTGSGSVVLSTSPTLTTPNIGAATATTVNGLTISSTTGTLTLANGSTLATVGGNSMTITTTGATSVTMPTSGTLLSTDTIASNAVTSFSGGTTGLTPASATQGVVTLGGTLVVANGGTGLTTATTNGVVFGNGTSAMGVTAAGTQYQVLQAGSGGVPQFGAVDLGQSAAVTGTLPGGNGGTGLSTWQAGNVLYATGTNTWAAADPGATSGVQAYDAGLTALAAKTSTGILVQTGADTYTSRTITGTATRIVVSDGSGVSGEPTIDLATVTQAASGNFVKVTLDSYGRVTGNTAVTTGDITALVDNTYVNVSGDTMTGNLIMSNSATVTGLPTPVNPTDAANKSYVDNAVTGLSWKQAVHVLAVGNVDLSGNQPLVVDGQTLADQERLLLVGQTDPYEDGIYVITLVAGSPGTYTLARSADCNTYQELNGAAVFVQTGTVYADTGWVQTATLTSLTTGATQNWVQFSGAGAYAAGDGLNLTGTTFSVDAGAGLGFEGTGAATALKVNTAAGNAVQIVSDNVELVLAAGSGLAQSSSGLTINASSVTNAMLQNPSFTATADSGSTTLELGNTLHIDGDSVKGLSFAVTKVGSTVTYAGTIADATSSQKGVASFGADFTVTSGAVALTHNSITFAADSSNSGAIALGGTLNIKGASGSAISTAGTAQNITIDVATATSSVKGVASFNTSGFVVTSGDVALKGDVAQSINAGSGSATPSSNAFTITGSAPISTSATGSTVTISAAAATTSALGVASFSSTNFDVAAGAVSIKSGGVSLTTNVTGTLPVANGGTGATTFTAGRVLLGDGTNPITTDAELSYDTTTNTFTLGTATIAAPTGGDVTITATATNGDINLVPNGTGQVIVGPAGAGTIASGAGESLTVTGTTTLTLNSTTGDLTIGLAASNANKVTISGPTATQYADGLANEDLANKYYVDQVAATGGKGDVKAVSATVALNANGTTNIGTALPAGATILSVKVKVTTADAAATLTVGKSGSVSEYMTAAENDPQTVGMYLAETMVTEASSTQVIATVASTAATASASCVVFVTYQLAEV